MNQQDRKLSVRMVEAKNLTVDRQVVPIDCYATISLGSKEERTTVVVNSSSPFWGEEYVFEDLDANFAPLSIVMWKRSDDHSKPDEPLCQISYPRILMTSGQLEDEQWFALCPMNPENNVSGDIRLKISYFPPKEDIKTHTFCVNAASCRNLIARDSQTNSSNPFVVLHLLPDLRVKSSQVTKIVNQTLNPVFDDTFIFVLDELRSDTEIHASVWHRDNEDSIFMGHCSIPVGDVKPGHKTDRWYTLLTKPAHIEDLNFLVERRKKLRKSELISKARAFAFSLQTADIDASFSAKTKQLHKFVDVKLNSMSYCVHCSGIMWALSMQSQCKQCRLYSHQRCTKFVMNNCGGVPMIRVKIRYSAIPLLPEDNYDKFLSVLSENNYSMVSLLGKVVHEREEAAKALVKVFEAKGKLYDYMTTILASEIATAADTHTLFRGNSIGSKSLDVYMKLVGMGHLKHILGAIIHNITSSDKSHEVDPMRVTKDDDIAANWKALTGYMNAITHAIFSNPAYFPLNLRTIFHFLQEKVTEKFPADENVRYTVVSGFIFLRFYAPAVLGPKLFGLVDGNSQTSRTLTLLAKTLQSLSNLTVFGQKEPFMTEMNSFIVSKMPQVKKFIDEISEIITEDKVEKKKLHIVNPKLEFINLRRECARAFDIYVRSAEKLVEGMRPEDKVLVVRLLEAMGEISDQVEKSSSLSLSGNGTKIKMNSDSEEATPSQFATEEEEEEIRAILTGKSPDSPKSVMIVSQGPIFLSDRRPTSMFDYYSSFGMKQKISSNRPGSLLNKFHTFTGKSSQPSNARKSLLTAADKQKKRISADLSSMSHSSTSGSDRTFEEPIETEEFTFTIEDTKVVQDQGTIPDQRTVQVERSELVDSPQPLTVEIISSTPVESAASPVSEIPSSSEPTSASVYFQGIDELEDILKRLDKMQSEDNSIPAERIADPKATKERNKMAALNVLQQAMEAVKETKFNVYSNCDVCHQPIEQGGDLIEYDNKVFHKNHFCCSVCDSTLMDEYKPTYYKSNLYCRIHDPTLTKKECASCELEITNIGIDAMGKHWHKDCFICTECGISLNASFLIHQGLPFCKQDYLKRAGLICGVCGEYIETEFIEVFGRKYHTTCKRCDHCAKLLAGRHLFSLNGLVLCSEHREEFSNCMACKGQIIGQVLVALQKQHQYHPEHFNCKYCQRNLAYLPFFEKDDDPVCQQCLFKSISP